MSQQPNERLMSILKVVDSLSHAMHVTDAIDNYPSIHRLLLAAMDIVRNDVAIELDNATRSAEL